MPDKKILLICISETDSRWKLKILVAPNSFKECAGSTEVADIICSALKKSGHEQIRLPVSDGGDGFLKVCAEAFTLKLTRRTFTSCFSEKKIRVSSARGSDGTVYLEAADFTGLRTIPLSKRNPLQLSSRNMGEYIRKTAQEMDSGETARGRIIIGIGGTGTSDLGLGISAAFGLKLLGDGGAELEVKPENYVKVRKIILPERMKIRTEAVLDVKIPLYGKSGTSIVFAPQKGASNEDVKVLEKGVRNIVKILKRDHGIDVTEKFIGAGGGMALGLSLISRMKTVTSREFLLKRLDLKRKIKWADIVISGEGKIDYQSYLEKAAGVIIEESVKQKKKVLFIAGTDALPAKFRRKELTIVSLKKMYGSVSAAIENYREGIKKAVVYSFGVQRLKIKLQSPKSKAKKF